MSRDFVFTSESVSEGHPDKVADRISDSVLDAILTQDPRARVACETLVTTGMTLVAGEITANASVDYPAIVRAAVRDIGYNSSTAMGFDWESCAVLVSLDKQSPDIAQGVDTGGAGDQGLMFGYATNETKVYMPMPIHLAHRLSEKHAEVRKNGQLPFLRPDGKSQVTVRYEDLKPVAISSVVVSVQHEPTVSEETLEEAVMSSIIKPVLLNNGLLREDANFVVNPHLHGKKAVPADAVQVFINPTGRFVIGGPVGDCGMTGRKIIVDTYGGFGHHGGGAFSGKDPTKVDRSASYMMRYVAKNIVAAGLAERCEVQVAYAIGVAEPLSVMVNSFGTGRIPDGKLAALVREHFDLRPRSMVQALDLLRPIFARTAAYGHFGRELPEFTWERTDMSQTLRDATGL